MTYLIAGLGNPGEEYALTRHNAGFMVVDELARRHNARYWKSEGGALTSEVSFGEHDIILVKPQTFMNLSGSALANVAKTHGVESDTVIVVHDELDIDAGTVRLKFDGGHAGHNGLRSIHEKLQTSAYARVRVGIGRPPGRMKAADYVLAALRKEAAEDLAVAVQTAADACEEIVCTSLAAAMNRYNTTN